MAMRLPRMSAIARSADAGEVAALELQARGRALRACAGSRSMMASAVSDLPQPDSPTMHSVSPRST